MNQMQATVKFNVKQEIRIAEKAVSLSDRANHFRVAQETFSEIQEFVERGSLQFPGGGEVIESNANAGKQVIDPRTPSGFGDPFFRRVNVEQKVELDAMLSKAEMASIRDQNNGTLYTEVKTGWAQVHGSGSLASADVRKVEFMALYAVAKNKIIRRRCDSCNKAYADIYYRRITDTGVHHKLLAMMVGEHYGFHASDCGEGETKCEVSNVCYEDFTLHSSYDEAVNGTNAWEFCHTVDYGEGVDMYDSSSAIGFPGYSGETKLNYNQYNEGNAAQRDYAFYVEDSNWIPIIAYGIYNIRGGLENERVQEAPKLLADSGNMIVRRICADCDEKYRDLFYKRIQPVPENIDLWHILTRNFKDQVGNIKGVDYEIYSSYEDAINLHNPWEACEGEGHIGPEHGDSVKCADNSDDSSDPSRIYYYSGNPNRIRLYPNEAIALSWDDNWEDFRYIDCIGLTIGRDMEMNTEEIEGVATPNVETIRLVTDGVQNTDDFPDSVTRNTGSDADGTYLLLEGRTPADFNDSWYFDPSSSVLSTKNFESTMRIKLNENGRTNTAAAVMITNGNFGFNSESLFIERGLWGDVGNIGNIGSYGITSYDTTFTFTIKRTSTFMEYSLMEYFINGNQVYYATRPLVTLGTRFGFRPHRGTFKVYDWSIELETGGKTYKLSPMNRRLRNVLENTYVYDGADMYNHYDEHNYNAIAMKRRLSTPIGSTVAGANLAYRKPTTQSSKCYSGKANRAVDGNIDGNWDDKSVTHTCNRSHSWWKVDLEENAIISMISVHNRYECCRERLNNFNVQIMDENDQVIHSQRFSTGNGDSIFLKKDFNFDDVTGRKVQIQLDHGYLSLAEVEVFGRFESSDLYLYKLSINEYLTWNEANDLTLSLSYRLPYRDELAEGHVRPERGYTNDEWMPVLHNDGIEGDYVNIGTWENRASNYISHKDYDQIGSLPEWGNDKNPRSERSSTYMYVISTPPTMAPTPDPWYPAAGRGRGFSSIGSVTEAEFREKWALSQTKILRRLCVNCARSHKEIYYRRFDSDGMLPDGFNLLDTVKNNWFSSQHNRFNVNFALYSTYEDALSDSNRWRYCNFNDRTVGFPRDCGPIGKVGGNWNSWINNVRNVAFHIDLKDANLNQAAAAGAAAAATETPTTSPTVSSQPTNAPTPAVFKTMLGFPGRCRPKITDPTDLWDDQYSYSLSDSMFNRNRKRGVKQAVFYIEGPSEPAAGEWMSEDDEMKAFLYPGSVLEADDKIVCKASALSIDTNNRFPGSFSSDMKPYTVRGQPDPHAGWYDLQGCGECHDWCGWFSSDDTFDGGINPRYQSWTPNNDVFACLTASELYESVQTSGIDSTPFNATFVPKELHDNGNQLASFLNFFPYLNKCSTSYEFSPKLPEYEYVGCYNDAEDRALPYNAGESLSLEDCHQTCRALGYHYFGRQDYSQCYCGGDTRNDKSYAKHGETSVNVPIGTRSDSGIEHDIGENEIADMGWELCIEDIYSGGTTHAISDVMGSCTKSRIMYGCKHESSDKVQLVAYGSREKAFTYTEGNDATIDGSVQWYLKADSSMGFTEAGDSITLRACDVNERDDPNRLCWHISNGYMKSGWRCGAPMPSYNGWSRMIWHTDVPTSSITYTPPQCNDCESDYIGSWISCVFRINYDQDYYPSGTCKSFDGAFDIPLATDHFSSDLMPYKYQVPTVEDPYAGYYDVQRCGHCTDFCSWVGPTHDGSGVNPLWKPYTETDHFSCKLAGGHTAPNGMTERLYFNTSFPYQKCDGEGAPTPAYRKEKYLGCFYDQESNRALPLAVGNKKIMTIETCADSCREKGYHYFSRQDQGYCYCGGFTAFDYSYAKYGEIDPHSPEFTCSACDGNNIGHLKQCVYQILDQFDPEVERKKHECSHIAAIDIRRLCYVSCRDKTRDYKNLLLCKTLSIDGLKYLNQEITQWLDFPICDTKDCIKYLHPLGGEVSQDIGVF